MSDNRSTTTSPLVHRISISTQDVPSLSSKRAESLANKPKGVTEANGMCVISWIRISLFVLAIIGFCTGFFASF